MYIQPNHTLEEGKEDQLIQDHELCTVKALQIKVLTYISSS